MWFLTFCLIVGKLNADPWGSGSATLTTIPQTPTKYVNGTRHVILRVSQSGDQPARPWPALWGTGAPLLQAAAPSASAGSPTATGSSPACTPASYSAVANISNHSTSNGIPTWKFLSHREHSLHRCWVFIPLLPVPYFLPLYLKWFFSLSSYRDVRQRKKQRYLHNWKIPLRGGGKGKDK